MSTPLLQAAQAPSQQPPDPQEQSQAVVAQTATWLDRASVLLSSHNLHDVETQMKQVEQLIHEGPLIQQSSAVLPELLASNDTSALLPPSVQEGYISDESPKVTTFSSSYQVKQKQTQEETLPIKRKVHSKEHEFDEHYDNHECNSIEEEAVDSNSDSLKEETEPSRSPFPASHASGSDAEARVGFLNSLRQDSSLHRQCLN